MIPQQPLAIRAPQILDRALDDAALGPREDVAPDLGLLRRGQRALGLHRAEGPVVPDELELAGRVGGGGEREEVGEREDRREGGLDVEEGEVV